MKRILAASAAVLSMSALPALGQDAAASFDWSGAYAGINYSSGDITGNFTLGVDGMGIHGGYLLDRGALVFGAELSASDLAIDESIARSKVNSAKALLGYSLNKALIYGTFGMSDVTLEDSGVELSDNGTLIGVGARYAVTDKVAVGLEYFKVESKDFATTGTDLSGDFWSAGISYRF